MQWDDTWEEETEGPRHGLPAWTLSAMLHLTLILSAAFLAGSSAPPAESRQQRTAGIALVQRTQERTLYFTEQSTSGDSSEALSAETVMTLPALDQVAANPELALPSLADLPGLKQPRAIPQAENMLSGAGRSRKLAGGQASTQVFGTRGQGSKFVYVFDRSESMQGFQGRPLAAAKSELIASLRDLKSINQFQIVFYNDKLNVFNPAYPRAPSILFASEENKNLAARFVESVVPLGGTRHMQPIETALAMDPDVVFFLTDAADPPLSPGQLARIRRLNRGSTINAIEFGSGPFGGGENFLIRLAGENQGQYVYVDVSKLPLRSS